MKLGIHAYVWCSLWSNETLDLIDKVSDFGMDFIDSRSCAWTCSTRKPSKTGWTG